MKDSRAVRRTVTRSRGVGTVGTSEIYEASARSALLTKYGIFFFTIIDNVAQSNFALALHAFCDKGVNQPLFFSTSAVYAVSDGLTERHVRILTLPYTQVSAKKRPVWRAGGTNWPSPPRFASRFLVPHHLTIDDNEEKETRTSPLMRVYPRS